MKVYLDGTPLQNPTASLMEPNMTFRRKNEEGQRAISFTAELEFTGADYDYLYAKLVTDVNAINSSVVLLFIDDCCDDLEYPFLIKPESLKWCEGSCSLTANAVEYTPESQAYACLENTLIWDDYAGFKSAAHPRIKYCLEYRPSIMQDIVLIVGLFTIFGATTILTMFATILLPMIGLINSIVSFANSNLGTSFSSITIGGFEDPIDIFNYVKDLFENTNGLISGCGHEHPAPLVRSYLDNVCNKCGMAWESSFYKESDPSKPNYDYYTLVYFSAPIKSGRDGIPYFGKPLVPFIEDNQPIHNGKTFVEELIQPMNGAWDIVGNKLRIHRRDFFFNQTPWFDITVYPKEKVISECFEWSKRRRPAYANIGYTRDALDWVGSEATTRWSDIIEWNSPLNPVQKGEFAKLFPYSAARFREDGIERDVLSDYGWMPYGVGAAIKDNDKAMIMNNGISFTPKLLIWDPVDINNAFVKRYGVAGFAAGRAVNYPMWVDATRPGNLYDRCWAIEDPRNTTFTGFDFEIQIQMDCATQKAQDINGTIVTSKGQSKTLEVIDIDWKTKIMTIRGTI